MRRKTFLFVSRKAPYGAGQAGEALEAALIAASLGQEVHLAYLDDGVFQLLRGQRPEALGTKDFTASLVELGEYDIDHVWVERQSLAERGLTEADLLVPATLLDRGEMAEIMAGMDVVVSA